MFHDAGDSRVDRVARSLRRLQLATAGMAVAIASLLLVGARASIQAAPVVRARSFEVTDENGVVRIRLGLDEQKNAVIEVGDPRGNVVTIRATSDFASIDVVGRNDGIGRNARVALAAGPSRVDRLGAVRPASSDAAVRVFSSRGEGERPTREDQAGSELRATVDWTGQAAEGSIIGWKSLRTTALQCVLPSRRSDKRSRRFDPHDVSSSLELNDQDTSDGCARFELLAGAGESRNETCDYSVSSLYACRRLNGGPAVDFGVHTTGSGYLSITPGLAGDHPMELAHLARAIYVGSSLKDGPTTMLFDDGAKLRAVFGRPYDLTGKPDGSVPVRRFVLSFLGEDGSVQQTLPATK